MRALSAAGVGLLAAGVLAACGGTPAPAATGTVPSPVPAETTAPYPTAIASEPAAVGTSGPGAAVPATSADGERTVRYPATRDGAIALVNAVYAAIEESTKSNDISQLRALVEPSCRCLKLDKFYRDLALKHQRALGGGYLRLQVKDFVQSGNFATVSAFYEAARGEVVDADGTVQARIPPRERSQDSIMLQKRGTGWVVTDIINLSRGAARS